MLTRVEFNIQTGVRKEIQQTVYRNEEKETIILDKGVEPPLGFAEYTGDFTDMEPELEAKLAE